MTFAGQSFTKSGAAGVVEQGLSTLTGETQETSFTATATSDVVLQVQQLRFDITPVPEPSSAILGGLGTLIMLRRRR